MPDELIFFWFIQVRYLTRYESARHLHLKVKVKGMLFDIALPLQDKANNRPYTIIDSFEEDKDNTTRELSEYCVVTQNDRSIAIPTLLIDICDGPSSDLESAKLNI